MHEKKLNLYKSLTKTRNLLFYIAIILCAASIFIQPQRQAFSFAPNTEIMMPVGWWGWYIPIHIVARDTTVPGIYWCGWPIPIMEYRGEIFSERFAFSETISRFHVIPHGIAFNTLFYWLVLLFGHKMYCIWNVRQKSK